MKAQASNILRRYIRVVAQRDPADLQYLRLSARTLHPVDLRQLAAELSGAAEHGHAIQHGPNWAKPDRADAATELRGLAKAIVMYGGPDAVRRDANRLLVNAVNAMGRPS